MPNTPDIASIAALLGDPTRARMLTTLMDGHAQTATELALHGGVSPSTASSHLARLGAGGLVATVRQGRHRYFRLATPEVAAAIEGLMSIAPGGGPRPARVGPQDERLRHARVCYDHLAGEAGVRLLDRMRQRNLVTESDAALALTVAGESWCTRLGVDLDAIRARRRRLCRACLDWSERRAHLAGAVGAAVLDRIFALRYGRRDNGSRAVHLSRTGEQFIEHLDLVR